MQKTIYVKDEVRWDAVKDAAEKLGMGVGEYLLGSRQKIVAPDIEQLDRIESKLEVLLIESRVEHIPMTRKVPVSAPDMSVGADFEIEESDAEILAAGQAKLDAARKAKGTVKAEKIAKVRGQVESVTGFSGSYSKEHQSRKKGK